MTENTVVMSRSTSDFPPNGIMEAWGSRKKKPTIIETSKLLMVFCFFAGNYKRRCHIRGTAFWKIWVQQLPAAMWGRAVKSQCLTSCCLNPTRLWGAGCCQTFLSTGPAGSHWPHPPPCPPAPPVDSNICKYEDSACLWIFPFSPKPYLTQPWSGEVLVRTRGESCFLVWTELTLAFRCWILPPTEWASPSHLLERKPDITTGLN